jgi:hypothetical protein
MNHTMHLSWMPIAILDGVETDDGDLRTLTDDSVRLDRVGVSSAEDGSDEGTVNRLSLIHWAKLRMRLRS